MLNNKVSFHSRQVHRLQEHSGESTQHSEKRIHELLDTMDSLKDVLNKAEEYGRTVKVQCPILIEIC